MLLHLGEGEIEIQCKSRALNAVKIIHMQYRSVGYKPRRSIGVNGLRHSSVEL